MTTETTGEESGGANGTKVKTACSSTRQRLRTDNRHRTKLYGNAGYSKRTSRFVGRCSNNRSGTKMMWCRRRRESNPLAQLEALQEESLSEGTETSQTGTEKKRERRTKKDSLREKMHRREELGRATGEENVRKKSFLDSDASTTKTWKSLSPWTDQDAPCEDPLIKDTPRQPQQRGDRQP